MAAKIKNIIIFTIIAASLILVYIFFIKKAPEEKSFISSSPNTVLSDTNTLQQNSLIAKDFLSVLLSVKSIKLNDTIFSDGVFIQLHDSGILLTAPSSGDQGRLNPFAPIGYEAAITPPTPPPTSPKVPM